MRSLKTPDLRQYMTLILTYFNLVFGRKPKSVQVVLKLAFIDIQSIGRQCLKIV